MLAGISKENLCFPLKLSFSIATISPCRLHPKMCPSHMSLSKAAVTNNFEAEAGN